ncbi:MAG TPA: Na+/H+ antiporter NhaA [Natronosporangium sp.]|jgi:NhaA family Na+:H+ antiporter
MRSPSSTDHQPGPVSGSEPAVRPGRGLGDSWLRWPVRLVQRIQRSENSSAALVLIAAVTALVIANLPLGGVYHRLWESEVTVEVAGAHLLDLTLRGLVNDALMTLFFFLVSLEIKRELLFGVLRDPRAAALPIIAAVGGMVVPAAIYTALNFGGPHLRGWGIPMATDIAFAVAVLAALGSRVPLGARMFLLALAIVDDVGAIVVIAVFYTSGVALAWILAAAGTVVAALGLQRARVHTVWAYVPLGVLGWYALHESGVHPTVIGVAFGLITPASAALSSESYRQATRRLIDQLVHRDDGAVADEVHERNHPTLRSIRKLTRHTQPPLHGLRNTLAPYISFGIVPLFAFANAGILVPDVSPRQWLLDPVVLGVALGLVVGKTIGIFGSAWLAVRLGLARYPTRMTSPHLLGVAVTGGIGFTVAMFVANLAFGDSDVLDVAKSGILLGSLVAAVAGYLMLRLTTRSDPDREPTGS